MGVMIFSQIIADCCHEKSICVRDKFRIASDVHVARLSAYFRAHCTSMSRPELDGCVGRIDPQVWIEPMNFDDDPLIILQLHLRLLLVAFDSIESR